MNIMATLDLPFDASARARAILQSVPQLEVSTGETARLVTSTSTFPVVLLEGIAPFPSATAPALAELIGPERIGLVVAERLLPNVRRELENVGLSYVDGAGAMHLSAPGFLIHLDPKSKSNNGLQTPPKGLGVVGVRIIQVLLSEPTRKWNVRELAALTSASTGQTHNILIRLEDEGLLRSDGSGPSRTRSIRNPTDLLDWLARVPSARRFQSKLSTYLYAPNPDQLITRLAHQAHESKATWALTGAAAAHSLGVSAVSAIPVAMVRVPAKPDLASSAQLLKLEPVTTGANVTLVADVGDLGRYGSNRIGPVVVASEVRIWLDMLSEPRGEDAAALFREAVLGY